MQRYWASWAGSLLAVLAAVLVACDPCHDRGFAPGLSGPIVTPFEVVTAPDVPLEPVREAMDLWGSSLFVLALQPWGEVSEGFLGGAIIYFESQSGEVWASTVLDAPRGEVRACAVRLDPEWPVTSEEVAHELGHCLGLEHDDCEESVMSMPPRAGSSPSERDLELLW